VQLLTATDYDYFIEKQHAEMSRVNRGISCDERDGGSLDEKNDIDITPPRVDSQGGVPSHLLEGAKKAETKSRLCSLA
jgi:hypothetical protein